MKKKLRLDVDALRVETFHATSAGAGRVGTVRGNVHAVELGAGGLPGDSEASCPPSDPWTCAGNEESCGGTCCGPACPGGGEAA